MNRLLFAGAQFLVIVVPGIAASAALFGRHRLTFAGRLALSYVMGFVVIALTSFSLAAASILSLPSLIFSLTIVTGGLAFVAIRNGGVKQWWRDLVEGVRETPWEVALGIAVLVAIAFVRLRYSPLPSVISNPTFRYWADAADIATSGGIPQETLQWGGVYPPSAMKNLLNEDYLVDEGVDYVALVRDRRNKGVLSVPHMAWKFDDLPFLELIHEGERTNFYRVVGLDTEGDFPDPDDFPGYTCRRGPIK